MSFQIFVNFKCYSSGTGQKAVDMAKLCAKYSCPVVVQPFDVFRVSSQTKAEVWCQHIDAVEFGKHTGWLLPQAAKDAGAVGVIINHAEHQTSNEVIEQTIQLCKQVGLKVMVCADSIEKGLFLQKFNPDYIALEIPELISGDISIVDARPGLVLDAVKQISVPVIVGAGVASGHDVCIAKKEGAVGVLPSSFVMKKSKNPLDAIKELHSGLTKTC